MKEKKLFDKRAIDPQVTLVSGSLSNQLSLSLCAGERE